MSSFFPQNWEKIKRLAIKINGMIKMSKRLSQSLTPFNTDIKSYISEERQTLSTIVEEVEWELVLAFQEKNVSISLRIKNVSLGDYRFKYKGKLQRLHNEVGSSGSLEYCL
jgi:hypothetical protein